MSTGLAAIGSGLKSRTRALRAGRLDGDSGFHQALYTRAIQAVGITRPAVLTPEELGKTM